MQNVGQWTKILGFPYQILGFTKPLHYPTQCQPYVVTTLLPVHGLLGDTFDIQNTLLVKVSMQLRQN